jgi:thymidylate kinase
MSKGLLIVVDGLLSTKVKVLSELIFSILNQDHKVVFFSCAAHKHQLITQMRNYLLEKQHKSKFNSIALLDILNNMSDMKHSIWNNTLCNNKPISDYYNNGYIVISDNYLNTSISTLAYGELIRNEFINFNTTDNPGIYMKVLYQNKLYEKLLDLPEPDKILLLDTEVNIIIIKTKINKESCAIRKVIRMSDVRELYLECNNNICTNIPADYKQSKLSCSKMMRKFFDSEFMKEINKYKK